MTDNYKYDFRCTLCVCAWREVDIPTQIAIERTLPRQNPSFSYSVGLGDSLISRARSEQATRFLLNPNAGDVLLFIDSDISFTPEDASRIAVECYNKYPIICGLYPTRSEDAPKPASRLFPGTNIRNVGDPNASPIEIVYGSTGFMAIRRSVLEDLSTKIPACLTGNKSEMYPFFQAYPFYHPTNVDKFGIHTGTNWEFLSEDWGFCELARQHGYKIWMDPAIRLGHMGQRQYWVSDIFQSTIDTTYMTVTEGSARKTGLIEDLAAFIDKEPNELMAMIQTMNVGGAYEEEWNNLEDKDDVEAVNKLLHQSDKGFMFHALNEATPSYIDRLKPALTTSGIVAIVGARCGGVVLDAMYNGRTPIYVDQPGKVRDFAEFRFKRRGMKLPIYDSLADIPDDMPVETVVFVDTLSFVPMTEVKRLIQEASDRLPDNGSIVSIYDTHDEWPMTLNKPDDVWQAIVDAGFVGGPFRWFKHNASDQD